MVVGEGAGEGILGVRGVALGRTFVVWAAEGESRAAAVAAAVAAVVGGGV